jgi:hypothetical protein
MFFTSSAETEYEAPATFTSVWRETEKGDKPPGA